MNIKTIQLTDEDNSILYPETGSSIVERPSGDTVEYSLSNKPNIKKYDDSSIEVEFPGIEDKVDKNIKEINDAKGNNNSLKERIDGIENELDIIKQYRCDNVNFLENVGSDRNIIITEDIYINKLDLFDITNLSITSAGSMKTIHITGKGYWDNIVLKRCSDIKFENIKIQHEHCESSSIIIHSFCNNILINNCYINSRTNGVGTGEWLDSTPDNFIENVTISNSSFDVGRMGVEIMNRSDIVRVKNIKINNNKFLWGSLTSLPADGERLAISLVGKQVGNVIQSNLFDSNEYGYWGVEIGSGVSTLIEGNIFSGKARYSIHFTFGTVDGVDIPSEDCVVSNNICITNDPLNQELYFRNVHNSIIKGNKLTSVRLSHGSSYNIISDNNLLGAQVSGVLEIGGGSRRNKSSNNIIKCLHGDKDCRGIFISGENSTENISLNDTVILPETATSQRFFQQLSPAINNVVEMIRGYIA